MEVGEGLFFFGLESVSFVAYEGKGKGKRRKGILALVLWTTDSATTGEIWSSFSVGIFDGLGGVYFRPPSFCWCILLPLRPQAEIPETAGVRCGFQPIGAFKRWECDNGRQATSVLLHVTTAGGTCSAVRCG